jgi:hypothetical protein
MQYEPYLDTERDALPAIAADATAYLQTVYVALAASRPYVQQASSIIANSDLCDTVLDAGDLEDDFGDVLALVKSCIEACGGRVPA